jgi:hypothetical protein
VRSDHLSKHELRHEKRALKEKRKQQQQAIAPQMRGVPVPGF